ncbi:MAG: FAD-dependent oxidoreductase [Clostridia bacterium]|nr:FAD-dependent oxidoreductase [Clostridia bacterium]
MEPITTPVLELPARSATLCEDIDVLVVGGGPAGIGAAIAAARGGMRVTLLEKRGFLGGNVTDSHVGIANHYMRRIPFVSSGLYAEMERGFHAAYGRAHFVGETERLHNEYMKLFLDDFVLDEGVELLFHTFVGDVVMRGDRIDAVVAYTKKGPVAYRASIVIDATGDGDVAAFAGVPFRQGRDSDGLCQPGTLMFTVAGVDVEWFRRQEDDIRSLRGVLTRLRDEGRYNLMHNRIPFIGGLTEAGLAMEMNYSETYGCDPTDSASLTRANLLARRQIAEFIEFLRLNVHGMENIELASISSEIGFRDSRRICGRYELTLDDMENNRRFEDSVFLFPRFYDLHALDGDWTQPDVIAKDSASMHYTPKPGEVFSVPYRCLVPERTDNLLVAGRCMSADHEAESAIRQVYACMQGGQAAGTAAGIAVRAGTAPGDVDIAELQARLRAGGVVL